MSFSPSQYPSRRFLAFLLFFGGVIGLGLILSDAPFWAFYVSPLLAAPLLIWEFRRLDQGRPVEAGSRPVAPSGRAAGARF